MTIHEATVQLPQNPYHNLYKDQAPNNIEIMLKMEKIKAYNKAQQDMLDAGWRPPELEKI